MAEVEETALGVARAAAKRAAEANPVLPSRPIGDAVADGGEPPGISAGGLGHARVRTAPPPLTPLPVSPFTDDYWRAEIAAYGLPRNGHGTWGTATIDRFRINGRCEDYLNNNWRNTQEEMPRLLLNGATWMSLTPMEIQSAALAIHRAHGTVVAGGLGLGYAPLRMAAKPGVSQVIVYEINPHVIEWFQHVFAGRPELEKIEIRQGNARKLFHGECADYVYMDIYQDILPNATVTDLKRFVRHNDIKRYNFWGWERVLMNTICNPNLRRFRDRLFRLGGFQFYCGKDLLSFFNFWFDHKIDGGTLARDLPSHAFDEDYVKKATNAMTRFWPL